MSYFQSDQVVRRGHPRAQSTNDLQEPLYEAQRAAARHDSVSSRADADGNTVVNPLHAQGGTVPSDAYPFAFQAPSPPQAKVSCFRCKVATVLIAILLASWSSYDFLYGAGDDWEPASESWVTINGTQFMLDCRPFVFSGFNTDNMKEAVVVMTAWSSYIGKTEGQMLIRRTMQQVAAAGLTVVRTWAHTTNPEYPLQDAPGRYKDKAFLALDTVVDEARRAGLRVVLTFVDNWKYYGGVDEFVDWSPTVPPRKKEYPPVNIQGDNTPAQFDEVRKDYETARHALFFTDENCKKMYKNHVKTIVERRNALNGRLYRDDPTIMGWSLINEPRCETWKVANCNTYMQKWLEDVAKYVKSIDPKHLITIGEEGFFDAESPRVAANPADWAPLMGQNFTGNHLIKEIDYVTTHVWPDNWDNYTYEFFYDWVNAHIDETETVIHKPLVLMEFGKKMFTRDRRREVVETRDPVFRTAYKIFHDATARSSVLRGILFWKLGVEIYENSGPGEYGVKFSDPTWPIVRDAALAIAKLTHKNVPAGECEKPCWVAGPPAYGIINQCVQRPNVCRALANKADNATIRAAPSGGIYTSEFECCLPGAGAFAKGCRPSAAKAKAPAVSSSMASDR